MVRWSSGSRASACHRTARSSVPRIASVSPGVSGSSSVGYSFSLRRRQALMCRLVMVRRRYPPTAALSLIRSHALYVENSALCSRSSASKRSPVRW